MTARDTYRTHETTAVLTDNELECTRTRTIDGIHRCLALLSGIAGRDWRYCGKAACARSRRCRGFACEPAADEADAGTSGPP